MTQTTMTRPSVSFEAQTPSEVSQILLQDGWHTVKNCELVQFAISEGSQSPVYFPSLRYTDEKGQTVITPLSRINGFLAGSQTAGKTNY